MTKIFISYSGNREDRALLYGTLKDHGLTPWRDVEDLPAGGATTSTITAELAACATVILWINTAFLTSDYIRVVELPSIARAWRTRGIRILPVFDGFTPTEGADAVSALGFEIGEQNGHVVAAGESMEETAGHIARRYVTTHVADAYAAGRLPVVRMVSYDDTADLRDVAVLNFDWRHRLVTGGLDGTTEAWLRSALTAATTSLKAIYGAVEVTLAVKAHLPLAAALGSSFGEPTGCTLHLTRNGSGLRVTRGPARGEQLAEHRYPQGPATSSTSAIEVAVTRNTDAGLQQHVASGHRFRDRTVFTPATGPGRFALEDTDQLNVWARQIADRIVTTSDSPGIERVDLFLAAPVELAIAIGWWSNASGPVDVLNWRNPSGPYDRLWTLP